jgi:DNA-directed RNA polymerase specialized sigma24 family protein
VASRTCGRDQELRVAAAEHERASYAVVVGSFDAFYSEHYQPVVRMAVALTCDGGAPEDLTQEAFLAARQSRCRIGAYDRPEMWARRVVTNRSASRVRRLVREPRALTRLRVSEALIFDPGDPVVDVWDAIATLPTRQARVVVLVSIEDLPVGDVSEILGCGPETVRTHLRRARGRHEQPLEEEDR